MAYVDGKTASDLAEEGPSSFDHALSLARQIAAGLEEAHEHGIVHRDIKSENIIVNAKGRAVILDFGLARHKGKTALTDPGVAMGTAPYMSPEQARGETVDARSDLWALGVVLYEAVTGSRPFDSGHHLATLYSIINEDPKPVGELRPGIPAVLERVVEKALEKDPAERWQSASEILAALGGAEPISGPNLTAARPALAAEAAPSICVQWT